MSYEANMSSTSNNDDRIIGRALDVYNFEVVEQTRALHDSVIYLERTWYIPVTELVCKYLKKFGLPAYFQFSGVDWYGVFGEDGKLLAVVGFEQVQDDDRMIPFVSHLCCEDSFLGRRALGQLTKFIEEIPIKLRGLILASNGKMKTMVNNRATHGAKRKWKTLALLVESEPGV